jgi:CBS domain-containing protein
MLVSDVMSTDPVTCGVGASLETAARRMLDRGVGSVVVLSDDDPVGILTETDTLRAGVLTDRPFGEVAVREVASGPLVTVTGSATVRKAVDRMHEEGIKKLPVVEDRDLIGIVTRSDIAAHYSDFVREAHEIDSQRDRWEARRGDPDEF